MKIKKPKFHSVFFSLLATIGIAGALIFLGFQGILFLTQSFAPESEWEAQPNWRSALANYAWYLNKDIGHPPNLEKAKLIAEENSLKIIIKGPNFFWSSHPESRRPKGRHFFHHPRLPIDIIRSPGAIAVEVHNDEWTTTFITDPPFPFFRSPYLLVLAAMWIMIVLIIFYRRVHKLFSPLLVLEHGFKELGKGNLGFKITQTARHEFKSLFSSFNEMTQKLNSMWIGQKRLLSDVSHELRTPITRIKLALEMAPEGPYKANISADVLELQTIISTLLESERLNSGEVPSREALNLTELTKNLIAKFNRDNNQRTIEVFLKDEIFINGNATLISMAISNVLENALKFSGKDKPVRLNLDIENRNAQLTIQDYGIGIAEDKIPLIFEPFFRIDQARTPKNGFGLGLSLVKKIIQAHNGQIKVESRLGTGSIFKIVLPLEKN